mgnify:CR=1 FL=1
MLLRVLSLELKAGQALKRPVFLRPAPAEGVLIRFAQRKSTPKRYPHGADTSPKAPNGEHGMTQESIENIVEIDDGKMFTTSQIVAQAFGKEHKNVLRDIDNLECSPEFRQLNFEHTPYVHPQNGETYPAYRLTRDGFAFLAMGFTGKKAAAWKEKFLLQLRTEAVPATIFVDDNDYKIWGLHFFNQDNRMKEFDSEFAALIGK